MDIILNKILNAREERAALRNTYCVEAEATLSFCLNIPGYPKSNQHTKSVFNILLSNLEIYLQANRINIDFKTAKNNIDEAGHFFILGLKDYKSDLYKLKNICEEFEINHSLGRIVDVDIYDENGRPISSGKRKKCLICNNNAAVDCMRQERHDINELRSLMFKMIDDFVEKHRQKLFERSLIEIANKSLHYEFLLSPKPGLVDFFGSGSHKDMNHYTFLNSAASLTTYWQDFAKAGFEYPGDLSKALIEIRRIGLMAEKAMFRSSGNVNTQKGVIFIFGISIFSAAYNFRNNSQTELQDIRETIKLICSHIVKNELGRSSYKIKTHGEETYHKYGLKGAGARWEAQNGFPVIFEYLLPFLEDKKTELLSENRKDIDKVLIDALLIIMSHLNDSNILFRSGEEKLKQIKELALKTLENIIFYDDLCDFCIKENISPGGSADMLALALFFFFIKQQKTHL